MYTWMLVLLAAANVRAAPAPSALASEPRGWVDITPGPRLAGWSRLAPVSTRRVPAQVNKDFELWVVDRKSGIIDCRGHLPPKGNGAGMDGSHEMLRYDQELGDFIFHVEWRFVDPARRGLNGGIYARVNGDATVWHQAQVGGMGAGYWFGDTRDGSGAIVRQQIPAQDQRVAPPGAWNVYEITGRGDTLTLWINGGVAAVWSGLKVRRGFVGLEAELHHLEFRNLRLKRLGP